MDDATIKDNLLRRRTELGYTQTEMARRLEMSLTAYRKLETGKTRILNEHISKFAASTGTSLAALVNGFEPLDPSMMGLDELRESYERMLKAKDEEHSVLVASLRRQIESLERTLRDKEDIIATDKKLIMLYERKESL